MELFQLSKYEMGELKELQAAYKREIGEDTPTDADFDRLSQAMEQGLILFYGCAEGDALVACCSITPTWSTFDYQRGGVFEDFYIVPAYRHRGIARQLVRFAYQQSGVSSLTVGCADCDLAMYQALGFRLPLGHLLAFEG